MSANANNGKLPQGHNMHGPVAGKGAGKGFKPKKGDKLNNRPNTAPGGRKCSEAERDRRVEEVARLIGGKAWSKSEVNAYMLRRYKLSQSSVTSIYIPRAKLFLQHQANMSRAQAKGFVVDTLIRNIKEGSGSERNRAAQLLADIYGLDAPKRHELTGAAGGPIQTADAELPPLSRERLAELVGLPTTVTNDKERNGQ